MVFRQTVGRTVEVTGVALHSGKQTCVRLKAAEPKIGVVFERTDLQGLRFPATLDHAGPSFYATVIQRDGESISTIEHLMAALYALQIDDVICEIDGPEVPILDGSSKPFVELIASAGTQQHTVPREYINLVRPVEVEHEDKRIAAYPCREYRVTYAIDFDHPRIGYQELSASLWGGNSFADKLAPARTFAFEADVERLRKNGLAIGGSLENAVVIGETEVLNPPLRFSDEFVRHKMLDLTGDLSLLGLPLRAHVVAYRAGHDMHARLARKIHETPDAWYVAPWSEEALGVA